MTTLRAGPATDAPPSSTVWRAALGPPVWIALGFAPLAVLQARALWDRPHLQGYPLAVVGGLVLARLATRSLGPLAPGAPVASWAGAGLSGALLVVAAVTAWPWLGAAAAMAGLLAAAYGLGGWRLLRAVLPAWAFVALAVLPPNATEGLVVVRLQGLVTQWASPVLYLLGVLHVTEGNVVKVPGRVLLVEQACSGVRSLLFVLGCTLFLVLRRGRPPVRGALLVVAAGVWVVLGNVVRVVAVAWLMARFGVDASTGVRHEALGLLVLAAVIGLTVSTDVLLRALPARDPAAPRRPWWRRWLSPGPSTQPSWSDPTAEPSWSDPAPPPTAEPPGPTRLPGLGETWLGSRWAAAAFGALGLAQAVWLGPMLADAVTPERFAARLEPLGKADLPGRQGTLVLADFRAEERDVASDFGQFSKVWRYRGGNGDAALVSVDYPFRGWHELSLCYQGVGWTLTRRRVGRSEGGWSVEATYAGPDGRRGSLWFGLDDRDGTPLEVFPSGGYLAYVRNRLAVFDAPAGEVVRRLAAGYEAMPRAYQVQVFVESDRPLSPEQTAGARAFFEEVRRRVRDRVRAATRGTGTGTGAKMEVTP